MWMGIFWILLSIYFFAKGYIVPKLNVSLGLIVLIFGIFRLYWWYISTYKPTQRRKKREKAIRQLRLERSKLEKKSEGEDKLEEETETTNPKEEGSE